MYLYPSTSHVYLLLLGTIFSLVSIREGRCHRKLATTQEDTSSNVATRDHRMSINSGTCSDNSKKNKKKCVDPGGIEYRILSELSEHDVTFASDD